MNPLLTKTTISYESVSVRPPRAVLLTNREKEPFARIVSIWTKKAQFYAKNTTENKAERIRECASLLSLITLDSKELAILVENDQGKPQALATCDLKRHKGKLALRVKVLVASPDNLANDIRGGGTAAMVQAIAISYALGLEGRLIVSPLENAIPFYENLGFKKTKKLDGGDYLELPARSRVHMPKEATVTAVKGQAIMDKLATALEDTTELNAALQELEAKKAQELQKLAQSQCKGSFFEALKNWVFCRGFQGTLGWIQQELEKIQDQKIIAAYFAI